MDNDTLLINVKIGSLRLPLRILRCDEEIYRNAEKLLVNRLEEFTAKYSQRPVEEIITIVAYNFAVLLYKQQYNEDVVPMAERLAQLNEELKSILSK